MQLQFQSKHKSIDTFTDFTLSDFCILTGKNGSGKTHLLEAIAGGHVKVDTLERKQILHLNYLDFEHNFQVKTDNTQKNQVWNRLNGGGNDIISQLKNQESMIGSYKVQIESAAAEKNKPVFELTQEDISGENNVAAFEAIQSYKSHLADLMNNDSYAEDLAQSVYDSVIKESHHFLSGISEAEFKKLFQKTVIGGKRLLSDLSNIFFEYYKNSEQNTLAKAKDGEFLTEDDFIKRYGVPPWDLVRDIFTGFGINFDVNDPEQEEVNSWEGPFEIRFKNIDKIRFIPFPDLSSGERILITLINAIYTANKRDSLPKLILLDEIDGPLNPSIIKKFLSYIKDNFVEKGIKIIIATHSPSTVAFAPEGSVFTVNSGKNPPVEPRANSEAVSILSEGFTVIEDLLKINTISANKIIISEGKNYSFLERARTIFADRDPDLAILNINIGGAGQLRTLFDFMKFFSSSKSFIFVFDHDYFTFPRQGENNEFIKDAEGNHVYGSRNMQPIKKSATTGNRFFIFSENKDSSSLRGIENLFPKNSTSTYAGEFNEKGPKNKTQFEKYILERNISEDFANFKQLFDFISGGDLHNLA